MTGAPAASRRPRPEAAAGPGADGPLAFGAGWQTLVGAWLLGVGLNYLPLTIYARSLLAPGNLEKELAGLDLDAQLRRAGRDQLLIAVPLAVAVASLVRRGP